MRVYILDKDSKGLAKIVLWLWENPYVKEVSVLKDTELFLDLIDREPPDMVFIWLGAGDIQGLKLGRTVKEIDPQVKIVFMADEKDYAIDAYEAGAFGYLLYPVDRKKLDDLLNYNNSAP